MGLITYRIVFCGKCDYLGKNEIISECKSKDIICPSYLDEISIETWFDHLVNEFVFIKKENVFINLVNLYVDYKSKYINEIRDKKLEQLGI